MRMPIMCRYPSPSVSDRQQVVLPVNARHAHAGWSCCLVLSDVRARHRRGAATSRRRRSSTRAAAWAAERKGDGRVGGRRHRAGAIHHRDGTRAVPGGRRRRRRCCSSPTCGGIPRAPSRPPTARAARPDDPPVEQPGRAPRSARSSATPALAAVARAARMRRFHTNGTWSEVGDHRRRPGAVLPAASTASSRRATARTRARCSDDRPDAELGHPARAAPARLRACSSRAAGAKELVHQGALVERDGRRSRSPSSPTATRRTSTAAGRSRASRAGSAPACAVAGMHRGGSRHRDPDRARRLRRAERRLGRPARRDRCSPRAATRRRRASCPLYGLATFALTKAICQGEGRHVGARPARRRGRAAARRAAACATPPASC